MSIKYRKPTSEECADRARVAAYTYTYSGVERMGYACWYPQMGGYVAKAVVCFDEPLTQNECFDAFVWHDGEFPFGEDDGPPREIHHCCAEQFVAFGNAVQAMQAKHEDKS